VFPNTSQVSSIPSQAVDLKISSGILAQAPKKRNVHCLSDGKNSFTSSQIHFEIIFYFSIEEKARIIDFYKSD
jgi:hypothetical protein